MAPPPQGRTKDYDGGLDDDGVDLNTGLVRKHKACKAGDFSRELMYHKKHGDGNGTACPHCAHREIRVQKHSPYRVFPALSHMSPEEIENLRRKPRGRKLDPLDSDATTPSPRGKGKGKKKKGKRKGKGKKKIDPIANRPPWGPSNAQSAKKALERHSYVASSTPYDDPERAERHWNRVMRSKRLAGDFVPSGNQRLAKDRVSTMVYMESPSENYLLRERYDAQQRKALGQTHEYELTMQQRQQWQAERKAKQRADRHAYNQRLLQTLPPTPQGDRGRRDTDDMGEAGPQGSGFAPMGPDDLVYIHEEPESLRQSRRPRPIYDDDDDDDEDFDYM